MTEMTGSTLTTTRRELPAPPADVPPRFWQLLAAEWVKLWSLRSTGWLLGLGALAVLGISANGARIDVQTWEDHPAPLALSPAIPRFPDRGYDAFRTAFMHQTYMIFVAVALALGAMTVCGEYATGLIRGTFTAVPARRAVVAAKLLVATTVTLAYGATVAAATFGVTQAILRGKHLGLPITAPGAARAVAATAVLAPVCALVGMAFAAVVRHSATTVLLAVGVVLLLPGFFTGDRHEWVKVTGNAMPWTAWDALTKNPAMHYDPGKYPETIGAAWTVLTAWALVAALLAVVIVDRRDV